MASIFVVCIILVQTVIDIARGREVSLVMEIWKVNCYSVFRKPFIIGPLHDLRTEHVCSSVKFLTYILKCRG